MIRRVLTIAAAGAVTFGLFWTMQALIGVSGELEEASASPSIDFVRLKRDRPIETKKRQPPQREKPDQPPPPPEMNLAQNMKPSDAVGEIIPMAETGVELEKATSLGAGGGDQDVVPLVRVDPQYPPQAKQRRVEGWVDIEFTIGTAGTVSDPRVIGASPPGVFERSALRAIRRWRYNPKVVDGTAVERPGVQVRIRFELGRG